ncbi:MAG: hypothetical protein ACRDMV_00120 [Streptosporangiales bacterium]
MPHEINGLPTHVLLVHVTVIAVPLAAASTVASAVWPAARRRLGVLTPVLALVALVCVPVTVDAGEWLGARVGHTPLVARHADLAAGLLPWVGALAVANYTWFRFGAPRVRDRCEPPGTVGEPSGTGGTTILAPSRARTHAGRTLVAGTVVASFLALTVAGGSSSTSGAVREHTERSPATSRRTCHIPTTRMPASTPGSSRRPCSV